MSDPEIPSRRRRLKLSDFRCLWERTVEPGSPLADSEDRQLYAANVYSGITSVMLVPFALSFIAFGVSAVRRFLRRRVLEVCLSAGIAYLACVAAVGFCSKLRRSFPLNLLPILVMSLALAVFANVFDSLFLHAVGVWSPLIIFFTLNVVSCLVRFDMSDALECRTFLWTVLASLVFGAAAFGFAHFLLGSPYLHAGVSVAVGFAFSLYTWADLQLIIHGKRYQLEPDELTTAANIVFTDFIMIFVHLIF